MNAISLPLSLVARVRREVLATDSHRQAQTYAIFTADDAVGGKPVSPSGNFAV